MERQHSTTSDREDRTQHSADQKQQYLWSTSLGWWYRLAAPPEPAATASLAQREKARRGRVVSLAMPVYMLFIFSLFVRAIIDGNFTQEMTACIGEAVCILALFLNRKGLIEIAGMLTIILQLVGSTFAMLNYPVGLTVDLLPLLYFTIVPDMLALAFFPAGSLLIIMCVSAIQIGAILVYGPHDAAITQLLQTAPYQIFSQIYCLQLLTTITLYVWGRSTEIAIARASRAEEIADFARQEKKLQEQELEHRRQLDTGIQQILQTHVAVANGDFHARAPLNRDHVLWQLAVALNTLIARLQSLSQSEQDLQQQLLYKEYGHTINQRPGHEQTRTPSPHMEKVDSAKHPAFKPGIQEISPTFFRSKKI